jgi:hypothetical protein
MNKDQIEIKLLDFSDKIAQLCNLLHKDSKDNAKVKTELGKILQELKDFMTQL